MNALEFFKEYGTAEGRRVAILAGTSYAYLWQVAHGYRRPSPEMAVKLEAASDGRMDRVSLVWPDWTRRPRKGNGGLGDGQPTGHVITI